MSELITIVVPVYGRPKLLKEALDSVYAQDDPDWRMLIADDGSDPQTFAYIEAQRSDPRISVVRRPMNLGLFGNLNASLADISTPWQLILCSDDLLLPTAIRDLKTTIAASQGSRLIMSSYLSIDAFGISRQDINNQFYDCFAPVTMFFDGSKMLEHLLHYGSVNGNITGLLIHNTLFQDVGLWRTGWKQAADWEWLVRACLQTSVFVRREPIAKVRVHDGQLSESNRKQHIESLEILEVLQLLLQHPQLKNCQKRSAWAAYHSQFILWNTIKSFPSLGFNKVRIILQAIRGSVGLLATIRALILIFPRRITVRVTRGALLPPS